MKPNRGVFRYANPGVFFLLLLLAVGGCMASAPVAPQGPTLPPAALPDYEKGTQFTYSNGTWEIVADTAPGSVTWLNHRGHVSNGSPDFTYRRTSWQTRKRAGERRFVERQDIWFRPPLSLWPLEVGKEAGYTEFGAWRESGGKEITYRTEWSCRVSGTASVSVIAGEFDTYRIDCRRTYRSFPREEKTWFYAPVIGHFVLRTTRYPDNRPERRLELVAVTPPHNGLTASQKSRIQQSFQEALEHRPSGHAVKWVLDEKRISGLTKPTDTFKLDNGTFCRRYIQEVATPDRHKTYFGLACRDPRGTWVIPQR